MHAFDGQTDERLTDRQTEFSSLDRVCTPCRLQRGRNYKENYYVQCCVLLCILDLALVVVTVINVGPEPDTRDQTPEPYLHRVSAVGVINFQVSSWVVTINKCWAAGAFCCYVFMMGVKTNLL